MTKMPAALTTTAELTALPTPSAPPPTWRPLYAEMTPMITPGTAHAADLNDPAASLRWRWVIDGQWKLIAPHARNEPDLSKRVGLYRRAEQIILNDAPLLPVWHYPYERLFQPYVRSVEVNGLGDPYIPLRKIWLERP